VLLLFNGLAPSSLFCWFPFCKPFVIDSLSPDDWDRFRAFWAEPKMPSREKCATRRALGDFTGFGELVLPLVSVRWGIGTSMANWSRDIENVLPPPVAEVGEASGDEFDITAAPAAREASNSRDQGQRSAMWGSVSGGGGNVVDALSRLH
jgi:hypothetical protein